MSLATSPSVTADAAARPSLFSPSIGMSGGTDTGILGVLERDSRVTRKPGRLRSVAIAMAMGVACIALLSIAWGNRVGDGALSPTPVADPGDQLGRTVDMQVSANAGQVLQGRAIPSATADSSPLAHHEALSAHDVAANSVGLRRQPEGGGTAVIIDAVAASATPRTAPAVDGSKVQGRKSRSRVAADRRKASPRPVTKPPVLRLTPARAARPSNTAKSANLSDSDVQIIEAIVTRSR